MPFPLFGDDACRPAFVVCIRRVARVAGSLLLIAAFALILLALFAPQANAQISPGPLSNAHRSLSGPAGCTQCHAVSAGSPNFRCLDCHREIATSLQQKRGLHPAIMDAGAGSSACARCHSEHNGENFSLVKWEPSQKAFDHRKTGFVLDGKHAGLDCNKCHNPQRISTVERLALSTKDLNRTFLGLSRNCITCHEDKHRGQLGANCTQCHNTTDWKRSFDHAKTRFALKGAHAQVTCQKCHTSGGDGLPRYAGLKFDRCAACHSDPHRGAFPQQTCESCHSVNGWKQSSFIARFDHSKTKYALLGRHLEIGCTTCHRRGDFKTEIAHQLCADCHKPDPHNGQFLKRADGGRCESCHSVEGFKQAKFALVEHNTTAFPLHGKHATVACAKCHVPAGRATRFKVKFAACTDCHQDTHRGQFAKAPYWNKCEQCHTDATFSPATFTLARHQQSRFVLAGGHVAVACNDCHKPIADTRVSAYRFEQVSCASCHNDPHRNQFAQRMARMDARGRPVGCEACHSTKAWQDLARFDHSTTKFELVGTHRAVECVGCHRPPNMERKLLNVSFNAAPSQCESCHEDPHGAQFAHSGRAAGCAGCHNSTKWRPSLFDHEKTQFSLKGGHQNVRCAACHTGLRAVNGKSVLFYKPTPTTCAACHGNSAIASGS